MSQNIIDTGQAANDGTGEPLRQAFTAINNNFSQIWNSGPVNSNVQITDNRILTLQTNQALILSPNGIGNVQTNSTVVPGVNSVYDLGSADRRWDTVWAQYVDIAGQASFNNLTVNGNLTVQGNIIEIGNIVTDSKTIQLANTASNASSANGSGITVGANDDIATLLYNSSTNTWTTNVGLSTAGNITGGNLTTGSQVIASGVIQSGTGLFTGGYLSVNGTTDLHETNVTGNLTATGNVTANYFFGNGSQLTGLPVSYSNANVVSLLASYGSNTISTAGNITAGNILGNIQAPNGNGAIVFNVDGILGADAGFNYDAVSNTMFVETGSFQGNPETGVQGFYVGVGSYTILGSPILGQFTSDIDSYSQVNLQNTNTGNLASGDYIITADNGTDDTFFLDLGLAGSNHADPDFFGDVSSANDGYLYVTGANEAGPSTGGPGNLILGSTNGVIKMFVGNTAQANVIATVDSTGLSVAGNIDLPTGGTVNFNGGGIRQVLNEDFYVRVSDDEDDGWSIYNTVDNGTGTVLTQTRIDSDGFYVQTDVAGSNYQWNFNGYQGITNFPGNLQGIYGGDTSFYAYDNGSGGMVEMKTISYIGDSLLANVTVRHPNVTISTQSSAYTWTFDGTGNLILPSEGNIVGVTPNNAGHLQWIGNSSGDGGGYTTMKLVPDDTRESSDQYLVIDPTAPGHIHIRAGGTQDNSSADLFLGGENTHFKVAAGANSEARILANSYAWTFGADSVLTVPGEGLIRSIGDVVTLQSYNVGTGNVNSVYLGSGGGLGFFDQDIGGNWLEIFRSGAEPEIRVPVGRGNLNIQTAQGITAYNWVFDNAGNLTAPGNITGNTGGFAIGYRDIPQVTFSANATAALTDAGKHFYSTTAGNLQVTIPDNANVAFPTGATITIVVNAAGNVVVAQGTGVSLYMAGSSATGNRTVGAYGLASVMKVATDTWVISGTGVY